MPDYTHNLCLSTAILTMVEKGQILSIYLVNPSGKPLSHPADGPKLHKPVEKMHGLSPEPGFASSTQGDSTMVHSYRKDFYLYKVVNLCTVALRSAYKSGL